MVHFELRAGRVAAGLSGAVLALATLAGCGGGGGIPTNASVKDFCTSARAFAKANSFKAGVKAADDLHDTGTPQAVPADARAGFELVVKLVRDAKDQNDLERRYKALTDAEKKSVDALDAYIAKTC